MTTARRLYNRVKAFDASAAAQNALTATAPELLAENKRQLFDGKLRTGGNLTPTYFEDPWFKSPQAAANYSAWKDRITPSQGRTAGAPNLFVSGLLYQTFTLRISGGAVIWGSFSPIAEDVIYKWTPNIFGVGGPYKLHYISMFLQPAFSTQVYKQIGLLPKKRA